MASLRFEWQTAVFESRANVPHKSGFYKSDPFPLPDVSETGPCPSVRPSLRSGVPHSGPAPWARRDGPSMAQHGSPGIHAGRPTTQNLRSASRRAGRSKTIAKTRSTARRGGLQADLFSEAHFSKQAGWQQSIYRRYPPRTNFSSASKSGIFATWSPTCTAARSSGLSGTSTKLSWLSRR
jgi:hypothetical protein